MTNKQFDSQAFFDGFRKYFGKITQRQVNALNVFNKMVIKDQDTFSLQEWAYVYATVIWETGHTFECVRESPKRTEEWRKKHFRYYPYYGRGYVQITWLRNYELFAKLLGVDLVNSPDLALVPETAFKILIKGCKGGLFTGRKLGFYASIDGKFDAVNARRVINGTDRAEEIASIYDKFIDILEKSLVENISPV